MSNNQVTQAAWGKRDTWRVLRLIVALVTVGWVARPIAEGLRERVNVEIATVIPLTKITETTINSPIATPIDPSQTTPVSDKGEKIGQLRSVKEVETASPRVWAYGLQFGALVAALWAGLWAVVALCRTDP